MKRDLSKADVPWGVRVSREDYNALANLLPMSGARTWLIETGLRGFVELCEQSPDYARWARLAIGRHMASDDRPTRAGQYQELSVRVSTQLWFRFNKLFAMPGASSWFVRTLVHEAVEKFSDEAQTLDDKVVTMVKEMIHPDPSEVTGDV